MQLKTMLAAASSAAVLAVAAPALAGTMVFDIQVTSATGVSGFTPFSFQETFTLTPSVATVSAASFDYSGDFTDTGSPVSASLKAAIDLTGANSYLTYDFGGFSPIPMLNFLQGDFFENVVNTHGSYQQSLAAFSANGPATSKDEAGLANYFAAEGAVPWYEKVENAGSTLLIEYDGKATLVSASPSAAPEPAAWALMILGFGGAGAVLRRRRNALAA